jgi:hypothetical protein
MKMIAPEENYFLQTLPESEKNSTFISSVAGAAEEILQQY